MSSAIGVVSGRPPVEETWDVAPSPIWEQTRRPGWVRLVNGLGRGLRGVGVRWPRIDVDGLMDAARPASGPPS